MRTTSMMPRNTNQFSRRLTLKLSKFIVKKSQMNKKLRITLKLWME